MSRLHHFVSVWRRNNYPRRNESERKGRGGKEELNSSDVVWSPEIHHVHLARQSHLIFPRTSKFDPHRRVSSVPFIAACDIVGINPDMFECAIRTPTRGARMSRMYVIRKSINPIPCIAVSCELTSTYLAIYLASHVPGHSARCSPLRPIVGTLVEQETPSSRAAEQECMTSMLAQVRTCSSRPRAIGSNRIISTDGNGTIDGQDYYYFRYYIMFSFREKKETFLDFCFYFCQKDKTREAT